MVLFLHLDHDTHVFDKIVTRIAMFLSDAIWADSNVTLERRAPKWIYGKGRVVSFLLSRRSLPKPRNPTPDFIFWGRLGAQKGLEKALGLFASVVQRRQNATFTIIGPDGGMEKDLRAQVERLGLHDHVVFKGPMRHDDIAAEASRASFYLQTSLNEGMAMSVVEAMQQGLIPVVTPVGEIARYCCDNGNAIFVRDNDSALEAVLDLLSNPDLYRRMSHRAAAYWQNKKLYRDDFLAAAKEFFENREYKV
jgi:glycosyltransferase involved in cell wall biosynthesis